MARMTGAISVPKAGNKDIRDSEDTKIMSKNIREMCILSSVS
jgi:hypothetical protein